MVATILFISKGPALNVSEDDYWHGASGERYLWGKEYVHWYEDGDNYYHTKELISGIIITIVVFSLPFVIKLLWSITAKHCNLRLEEKQIVGVLKSPFSQKQIQIPIEKIDNVFIAHTFLDKLRGGETVIIHSNSGAVKFHFVYNATEFSEAVMQRIETVKKDYGNDYKEQSSNIDSIYKKIYELKKMRELELITEDEFEAKKQELMSEI